jgi:rod shape-determining protein MreB
MRSVCGRSTRSLYGLVEMFSSLLSNTVYVRIRKNGIAARNIQSGKDVTLEAAIPFTTTRLLIGHVGAVEKLVKTALKAVLPDSLWSPSPVVVVHPLEMVEGGLCEVEERLFREVFLGAGAARAIVWVGAELTDAQVQAKANEK